MGKKKKKSGSNGAKPMSDKRFLAEKARTLPVYKCYVTEGCETFGEAEVVVTRERASGNLCVGGFLCDTWCMGVKDAFGSVNMTKDDFQEKILDRNPRLKECDYVLAHNIIYGAEAFAADAHIEPAPEFELWSNVLEEDTEDVPLMDIEFGDHGKYHLIAQAGSREALYARGLQERLGDDFIFDIGYGPGMFKDDDDSYDYDDEDYDSESDDLFADDAPESMEDVLQRISDGLAKTQEEDKRHPEEKYSYQHPEYPDKLEIKHSFIAEEFRKPTSRLVLPEKVIDRILALPKDEAVHDISAIVMYTIGRTWRDIDAETGESEYDDTILHSMAMLTQLADPAGLDAVMEVLRQDFAFHEFHLGDMVDVILPQALYVMGRNHLDILEEFLSHPGYELFSKVCVSRSLAFIAMEEPERRGEIIELFRRYLGYMQENIPTVNGCSGGLAGHIMCNLIDLKAKELLPEIKKLYDSGYVNMNICGDYEQVEEEVNSMRAPLDRFDFTDIKEFYHQVQKTFSH